VVAMKVIEGVRRERAAAAAAAQIPIKIHNQQ